MQAPPSASASSPSPLVQACLPRSASGACPGPGQSGLGDGVTGVAARGALLICTDNGGWRWEPLL